MQLLNGLIDLDDLRVSHLDFLTLSSHLVFVNEHRQHNDQLLSAQSTQHTLKKQLCQQQLVASLNETRNLSLLVRHVLLVHHPQSP